MDNKKEDVQGVPVQKHPQNELNNVEKYELKNEIINIFAKNNLSIRQANEILTSVLENLDTIHPWNRY
ncbi:hypothetical protein OSC52_15445 [Clostridium pasteurianum]|uniref:hypothetical protein n=1 Tax=Clostridium pasteurianum TaxID=1501 RepID=UPI002260E8E0|nr:hypothetical protein [Clostridium pasteurianum]UZW13231.1 hypothetical protein OSC52_15445 [Clostridium pasteurianum]